MYGKHWETLAIISFTKELPQNTTVIQQEHTEQYSKVSMTVPLGGSKIPTKIKKNYFFTMQPKIVVLFILRTTEHLEFSLILQKQPSTMWSPHCILIFGTVLKEKRLETVQKSLFSKSPKIGYRKKQMSILPFWEEVGVKKWSQFLDFGHSKSCI